MSDSIHFSAIEATGQEKATCPLCTENSIDLEFEFSSEARPKEELRGRCCIACAAALLDAMRSLAIADQDELLSDPRITRYLSKYVN